MTGYNNGNNKAAPEKQVVKKGLEILFYFRQLKTKDIKPEKSKINEVMAETLSIFKSCYVEYKVVIWYLYRN